MWQGADRIEMDGKRAVAFTLVLLLAVAITSGVIHKARVQAQTQPKLEEFLTRLEEVYRGIRDLEAVVTIVSQKLPEGKERGASRLKIGALLGQGVLRVEFLDPPGMRGQVYTLKGNVLSQYIPVNNMIIIQEITEAHLLYPLLESLNLDLLSIVHRLQEEGFSLRLTQEIALPKRELRLRVITVGELARTGLAPSPPSLSLGLSISVSGASAPGLEAADSELEIELALTLKVGALQVGDYILEAVPSEAVELRGLGRRMERQLIWVDPLTFMPKRLETYLAREVREKLRRERHITVINEIKLNSGLTEKDLLALPRDARILDRRTKP